MGISLVLILRIYLISLEWELRIFDQIPNEFSAMSEVQLSYKLKRAFFDSIKCNTYLMACWLARFSINKVKMYHVRILLTYLKFLINAGDNEPKQRYWGRHSNRRQKNHLSIFFLKCKIRIFMRRYFFGVISFICFYHQPFDGK